MQKLYRALQNVSWKNSIIERGAIVMLSLSPEKEARLQSALAEVIVFLEDVPGWTRRASRLGLHGYDDAQTVLLADADELAKTLGVQPATIARWKKELMDYLNCLTDRRSG